MTIISKHITNSLAATAILAAFTHSGFGQVNSWNSPASGNWEDDHWSLGTPPGQGQTVMITNAGWKAVAINPATRQEHPESLTVGSLHLDAPADSRTTLLLNYFGSETPLHVAGDLSIDLNGTLLNLHSALEIDGSLVSSGTYEQHYGSLIATNGVCLAGGTWTLDQPNLQLADVSIDGRDLVLYLDGTLDAKALSVRSVIYYAQGYAEYGSCEQNGGVLNVRGPISVQGAGGYPSSSYHFPANFRLNGGRVHAQSLSIGPVSQWDQTNAECFIDGSVEVQGYADYYGMFTWLTFDGTFTCASLSCDGADLTQSGLLVCSNSLSISGWATYRFPPPPWAGFAVYYCKSGNLIARDIFVRAVMFIGSSSEPHRIINTGIFFLSGYLSAGEADEVLGELTLGDYPFRDSFIGMWAGNTRLRFADSSGAAWAEGTTLSITGWEGSATGGGADQLGFGTNAAGLTPDQLNRILFVDPAGFPPGVYNAAILETGEVVPTFLPVLHITRTSIPHSATVTWHATDTMLQTSTNSAGPFTDLTNATTSYTVVITNEPSRFFRLRRTSMP